MLKKIASIYVLSISMLSVMVSNAAVPNTYISVQLGYASTHMKDKTNIAAIWDATKTLFTADGGAINLSNNGLAGRLAVGYQFNQHFTIEMGYLQLSKKKINGDSYRTPASISLNQRAIDLTGKAILLITNNLNMYGKLGAAYLTTKIDGKRYRNNNTVTTYDLNGAADITQHKWAPETTVGVSYEITPSVSIDTSWLHIQLIGKNRPGNIDFVAVGVDYNFD
ncbi:MAG: outer membrane beta-barrel protein [Pseudomonadota bacterium]